MDKLLEEWQPRKFENGYEHFTIKDGTPEANAIKFLECIKKRNFGTPVSLYFENIFGKVSVKEKAGLFRKEYKNLKLDRYSVAKIDDRGASVTHVFVSVVYKLYGVTKNKEIDFRMIYEKNGKTENRLVEGGIWKIVNIEGITNQLRFYDPK